MRRDGRRIRGHHGGAGGMGANAVFDAIGPSVHNAHLAVVAAEDIGANLSITVSKPWPTEAPPVTTSTSPPL